MLHFCFHDVHVVEANDYFTSVDNVARETACFKGCQMFLLAYGVLELNGIEHL